MTNRPEDQAGGGGDPKTPEDASFEANDTRLNKELGRFDRARAGSKGAEYGHDENYAPGYHEGGARFGFFNNQGEPKTPAPGPAKGDKGDKGGGET
jgi:hypothetical protein